MYEIIVFGSHHLTVYYEDFVVGRYASWMDLIESDALDIALDDALGDLRVRYSD